MGSEINVDTVKQEINNDRGFEINPYRKVVLNDVYKDEIKTVQMEYWSILSDNVKYAQHDEQSKTAHHLDVKIFDYRHHKKLYNSLKGEGGRL